MTIKEAREHITFCNHNYANGFIGCGAENSEDHRKYVKAGYIIQGYEAKEAQLEGALIIPKGWWVEQTWSPICIDGVMTRHTVEITNGKLTYSAEADSKHEALLNALEQIEGGEVC